MGKIKVALAGVGNCASALIQGIQYYRKNPPKEDNLTTGLMHPKFGDYRVEDITFVAAFEVNRRKIGSEKGARYYAQQALDAGCGFVNCIPEFIASNDGWAKKFEDRKLPIAGDDIKSQVGATIVHRALVDLFLKRGVRVDESYQLNLGGDTDFLNMTVEERLHSKRIRKTTSVASLIPYDVPTRIGPSDYVPHLKNKKICYIYMKGRKWGNIPLQIDLKLSVEDSPNSAGVVADVIRAVKIGLDRGVGGALTSISSYSFKYPPVKIPDGQAREWVEEFIKVTRER